MKKFIVAPVIPVLLFGLVLLTSCQGTQKSTSTAGPKGPTVVYDVCSEAQITKFEYPIEEKCEIAKKPCLTFVMTVKNVSDKPQRFNVKVIMPKEGKGVGGLIPVKGKKDKATGKRKPPLVEPGESVTEKYPALQFELPERIEVAITVMQ